LSRWCTRRVRGAPGATLAWADLPADGPRTAAGVATATGTDEPSLYRVRRALACFGVLEEIVPGTFALGAHAGGLLTDSPSSLRHLIQLFDKDRATGAQVFDDKFVVDHFVAYVDRRPEDFQGAVDDFDRPVHTGAEATGVGEFDLHAVPRVLRAKYWITAIPVGAGLPAMRA